jgi:small subunit ribosomal protein S10
MSTENPGRVPPEDKLSGSSKKSGKNINVLIKSFDAKVLDETAKKIADTFRKIGLTFSGPIPLPVHTKRFIFLKSPHVNKDARQTFEIKDMKRLIQIEESRSAIAALHGMKDIHPSVNIEVKFAKSNEKKVSK